MIDDVIAVFSAFAWAPVHRRPTPAFERRDVFARQRLTALDTTPEAERK